MSAETTLPFNTTPDTTVVVDPDSDSNRPPPYSADENAEEGEYCQLRVIRYDKSVHPHDVLVLVTYSSEITTPTTCDENNKCYFFDYAQINTPKVAAALTDVIMQLPQSFLDTITEKAPGFPLDVHLNVLNRTRRGSRENVNLLKGFLYRLHVCTNYEETNRIELDI